MSPTDQRPVVLSVEQALSMSYATLRFVHLGWRVIRVEATPIPGRAKGDPNRTLIWVRREGNRRYQGRAYYAIRQGNWKLLQNTAFEPMQLVNLGKDPKEAKPMPPNGKVANELSRALMDHLMRAGKIPWQKP